MEPVWARSERAQKAFALVRALQDAFQEGLERVAEEAGMPQRFVRIQWLREGGRFGGGERAYTADGPAYGRGAINVSQVQYEDDPARPLASATAISTIIHPAHPRCPSVHIHISYTEPKEGRGYWRLMADLNPALEVPEETEMFAERLAKAAPQHLARAKEEGARYFWIPALGRHRGVFHFYLEQHREADFEAELALARAVGEAATSGYLDVLAHALSEAKERAPTDEERRAQLAYHTLYFFQVLTLDRGTTAGLLVHADNDLGILGSLPPRVDRTLLASWRARMPEAQRPLLDAILAALPEEDAPVVDEATKQRLADALRAFYRAHPEALDLQAKASTPPPTIANHLGRRA